MTRDEHLKWCKQRALEYLQPGQYFSLDDAMASMASDLGKHEETRRDHQSTIGLMFSLHSAGQLSTADKMREFINGFN
jgi:predicted YcjX-like family ATPase